MMFTMNRTKNPAYGTCSDKTAKQVRSKNSKTILRIKWENADRNSDTLYKKIIVRCILLLMQLNDTFYVEDKLFGPSVDRLKPNFW